MIHADRAAAAKIQAAGGVRTLAFDASAPLQLSSGALFAPLSIAFETYGALNDARSNAVLVCHPLGADQFVASPNPVTGRPGWWPRIVGPGRPLDTNRFFVIATNVLGGSMGASGPNAPAPDGRAYGLRFPAISIADTVRAQSMLVEALGVETLFLVIGPELGGMQALSWASAYPKRVFACASVATAARHAPHNIALGELSRQAIMADPDWRDGAYHSYGPRPAKGAAVARAGTLVAGLAEADLRARLEAARVSNRFGLAIEQPEAARNHSAGYVERFDANSFLYLSRAMDSFDLAADFGGRLANAFDGSTARHLVVSFTQDWRYPPEESRAIARALIASGAEVSSVEINSAAGHEAYLGAEPEFEAIVTGFIDAAAAARGLAL
jgi:homoserine O-acetyltransferase